MTQLLDRPDAVFLAGRETFQASLPHLANATKALTGVIERVQQAKLKPSSVEALSHQFNELASLLEETRARVHSRTNGPIADEAVRRPLIQELQQSSDVTTKINAFLTIVNALNKRSEELSKRIFFPCLRAKRDAKVIGALDVGLAGAAENFKTHCAPAILQVLCAHDPPPLLSNPPSSGTETGDVLPPGGDHNNLAESDISVVSTPSARNGGRNTPPSPDDGVLEKLPRVDADYRADINALKSEYLPGTRTQVFKELESWVEGRSPQFLNKRICVLSGGAGTGKSTVASEFARRLSERSQLGASFFFVRGADDLNSTKLFFSVIAFQLAGHQHSLRAHIVKAAREHLKKGVRLQMKYQAEDLLIRPLDAVTNLHDRKPVTIVIDALDECTQGHPEDLRRMLQLLVSCTRKGVPMNVFLTSRPEHHIENILCSPEFSTDIHTVSLHDVSRVSVDGDIKLYLTKRIGRIPSSATLLHHYPDIIDQLTARAEGLFVYAQTVMNFLEHEPTHLMEQLGMLLSDDPSIHGALEPLDQLYLAVLESAYPLARTRPNTPAHDRLQSILACVALLRDHLTPRVLAQLMNIPHEDSLSVLNKLRSVVLCGRDDPDATFRPLHSTFSEFLLDKTRCTNPLYFVDTQAHQARLAEGCLRTLNASLSRNMLQLTPAEFGKINLLDLAPRARTYIPAHVRYACMHWAGHLAQAGGSVELRRLLDDFAHGRLLMWIETLGYMDKLDVAESALEAASASSQCPRLAGELFTKGAELVKSRSADIDHCPYEVYAYGSMAGIVQDGDIPPTPSESGSLASVDTPAQDKTDSPISRKSAAVTLQMQKSESTASKGSQSTPSQASKSSSTASGKSNSTGSHRSQVAPTAVKRNGRSGSESAADLNGHGREASGHEPDIGDLLRRRAQAGQTSDTPLGTHAT